MDNNKLFWGVWRNIFIKSNILYHLRLYYKNDKVKIYSMKQLEEYKSRSYISKLEIHPNEPLEPKGVIPEVSELEFSFKFNSIIKKDDIPNTVKKIIIWNYDYSQIIEDGALPSSLEYLKMNGEQPDIEFGINRKLPSQLRELELYSFFQYIPPRTLPIGLRVLKIKLDQDELNPHRINKDTFPLSLQVLQFDGFNQGLEDSILPSSITDLNLRDFNEPIKPNDLPSSLKKLSLYSFDHPLEEGSLPQSLESLKFGMFNCQLEANNLPSSLKELNFGQRYDYEFTSDSLPSSLESLYLSNEYKSTILPNVLPINLKSLSLGHFFNSPLEIDSIPNGLKSITFGFWYEQIITPGVLPSSITSIFCNSKMEHYFSNDSIPSSAIVTYSDDISDEDDDYSDDHSY